MSTETAVKHTPGPWLHNDHGIVVGPIGMDPRIAYVYAEFADKTVEEREANARLIAAAPELLEALKEIVNSTMTPVGIRLIADSAIRKATEGK